MNIFAFLVLVFSVTVIAEDKTSIEYEFKLVMKCLHKVHMTGEEIEFVQENLMRMQDDKIDEKARKIFEKFGYFAACVEEDLGMIEDSKLVVDKIMEGVERDMARKPVNKDFVKKCANALNDDSELTREERAAGMSRCLMAGRIRRRVSQQVIAEDKNSLKYNRVLQICLHKAHMIGAEVQFAQKILMRIPDDNIIDNTKEILKKYGYFAACVEEDKGMIKDSKLVVGKIMAAIDRNIGDYPVDKDFVKECVNALNEDSELTREERATDMERCMIAGYYRQGQKKVIAEDKDSTEYKYEVMMNCLHEADMTGEEMEFAQEELTKMQDNDIDNKTQELLKKYGYFAACAEEKMGMMKDSDLVVDKIMGQLVNNMDNYPINKDFVKECMNALNDDNEMTREEKATGVMRCILTGHIDKNQKK